MLDGKIFSLIKCVRVFFSKIITGLVLILKFIGYACAEIAEFGQFSHIRLTHELRGSRSGNPIISPFFMCEMQ